MKKYILSVILSLLVSGVSTAAVRYEVIGLGMGEAAAINNKGQVVGGLMGYAFIWENGQTRYICEEGYATSINELGQVVGTAGVGDAFVWEDGNMTYLPFPGYSSVAYDINNSGQIVGRTTSYETFDQYGVIYKNGVMSIDESVYDYRSINNHGDIVGGQRYLNEGVSEYRPFVMQEDGTITYLTVQYVPTLGFITARSINDMGQIVGYTWSGEPIGTQAYMWLMDGSYISLGHLGTSGSVAHSINNRGQVVGASGSVAYIWEDGVMTDLNTLIPEDSGWDLQLAYGINDLGWIVGVGEGPDNNMAFVLRPVPEPMTVMLLGVGAVAAFRRK